jgi:hypothetical protein
MRKTVRIVPLLLLALLAVPLAGVPSSPALEPVAPAFETTVSVGPADEEPIQLLDRRNGLLCSFVVTAPGTRLEFDSQRLLTRPGVPVSATQRIDGLTFEFNASSDAKRVDTRVRITRDGKVLSTSRSSVRIDRGQSAK